MYEHALFLKKHKGGMLFVALCVDDLIFTENKAELVEEFNKFSHTMSYVVNLSPTMTYQGSVGMLGKELWYHHTLLHLFDTVQV